MIIALVDDYSVRVGSTVEDIVDPDSEDEGEVREGQFATVVDDWAGRRGGNS
jgi:hypothetical protein